MFFADGLKTMIKVLLYFCVGVLLNEIFNKFLVQLLGEYQIKI